MALPRAQNLSLRWRGHILTLCKTVSQARNLSLKWRKHSGSCSDGDGSAVFTILSQARNLNLNWLKYSDPQCGVIPSPRVYMSYMKGTVWPSVWFYPKPKSALERQNCSNLSNVLPWAGQLITIEYGNILILSIIVPSLKPKRPGMLGPNLQTTLGIKGWRLRFAATTSVDDIQAQRIRYWGCCDPIYGWLSSLNDQGLGMLRSRGISLELKGEKTRDAVTPSTDDTRA